MKESYPSIKTFKSSFSTSSKDSSSLSTSEEYFELFADSYSDEELVESSFISLLIERILFVESSQVSPYSNKKK